MPAPNKIAAPPGVAFAQRSGTRDLLSIAFFVNGKPLWILDDAIKTFEIIEAADRSAMSEGQPVKLPLGW